MDGPININQHITIHPFFFKSHFFQEQLMGGIIHEEDKEATKEDDIEYLVGSLGLVPPSTE